MYAVPVSKNAYPVKLPTEAPDAVIVTLGMFFWHTGYPAITGGPTYPFGGQTRGVVLKPDSTAAFRPTVNIGAGVQLPAVVISQVWIAAGLSMKPAFT